MKKKSRHESPCGSGEPPKCRLRLFVAGDEPNSVAARASLERICSEHPEWDWQVEVVDVLRDSRPAVEERILVTPTLVVLGPERRFVVSGSLADTKRVLAAVQTGSESA